jgi:hypothetical protein
MFVREKRNPLSVISRTLLQSCARNVGGDWDAVTILGSASGEGETRPPNFRLRHQPPVYDAARQCPFLPLAESQEAIWVVSNRADQRNRWLV